jgi:hypothetical protein
MCRQVEGYPADKGLKTQYEWSKAWNKKRFRELGWDIDGLSDTDNGEDGQGAATAGRSGAVDSDDDVPLFASQASRTPPTVKKPEADSGGEPLRKRRHRPRRGAEIDKAIASVRDGLGAEKVQLIRPDEESGDLDRKLEELINVCIEHPHVSSLELQVCEIQHTLHAEIETVSLWPGNSARCDGGSSLRRSCAPRARDAQQWQPARLLGSDGNHARRRGGTLAG